MTRAPRRAFTLLELILVLALIALLVAVALPSIQAMLSDVKLQAAADELQARFAEARARAIEEGRPYRVAMIPGQSDYRVAPDAPEFWIGGQSAADEANATPPLIVEDKLKDNIVFQLGDSQGRAGDSGPWAHLASFQPDGSCDSDCTIRLELEDCRPIEITVRSLTGSVTARKANVGGN